MGMMNHQMNFWLYKSRFTWDLTSNHGGYNRNNMVYGCLWHMVFEHPTFGSNYHSKKRYKETRMMVPYFLYLEVSWTFHGIVVVPLTGDS
jgi:hypothetical protein